MWAIGLRKEKKINHIEFWVINVYSVELKFIFFAVKLNQNIFNFQCSRCIAVIAHITAQSTIIYSILHM